MMLTRVPAVTTSVGSAGSWAGRAVSVRSVAWIVTDHLGGLVFDVVCAVVVARWSYCESRSIRPCCVRAGSMVPRRPLAWFFLPVIGSQAASVLAGGRPLPPRS